MDEIEIKITTEADINVLVALGKQTFYEAFKDQNSEADMQRYLAEAFTTEKLRQEFTEKDTRFFLATVQGKPVAYAKIRNEKVPEKLKGKRMLELERLYVLAEFQSKRIGHLLMQTCIDFARENQFQLLWLGVWEHNLKAQKFYHRFGFEAFDKHIFMLGTDAQTDLLLKLEL